MNTHPDKPVYPGADFSYPVFRERILEAVKNQKLVLQHPEIATEFRRENHDDQLCYNTYPGIVTPAGSCHCVMGAAYPEGVKVRDDAPFQAVDGLSHSPVEGVFYGWLQEWHDSVMSISWGEVQFFETNRKLFLAFIENLPEQMPSPLEICKLARPMTPSLWEYRAERFKAGVTEE